MPRILSLATAVGLMLALSAAAQDAPSPTRTSCSKTDSGFPSWPAKSLRSRLKSRTWRRYPGARQSLKRAWEEAPRNDPAACRVGYDLVYPADLEPRDFDLFVALRREVAPGNPEGALRENGGTLMIPRPEHDHRVDRADPTANVFRVRLMTFSPCVQQQFGERFLPTLAFRADKCSQQHCSALKFETPPGETTARFRIVTKQP